MAATNAVAVETGNVSAGTSDFAMVVVDKLPGVHREIDMVTTPAGKPVAMVHCNNCTSDLNAWVGLLGEAAEALGAKVDTGTLFDLLFRKALEGDADGGGLLSYNYEAGEGVTNMDEGRPLFLRKPGARLDLATFMRVQLMSALATLSVGLEILSRDEQVRIRRLCAHGGFFKTPEVGQRLLSAAVGAPVTVMETAGEGGPYGMALLCAFLLRRSEGESLEDYLEHKVFASAPTHTLSATPEERAGFRAFLLSWCQVFPVEEAAAQIF
jgi:sugar (pentulose or hexulose) kinase